MKCSLFHLPLLPLLALGCGRSPSAPPSPPPAEHEAATPTDAPPIAPPTAVHPEVDVHASDPAVCSDAGTPAWYLVAKGKLCSGQSRLEWLDVYGTPHLFSPSPAPLNAFRWVAELPDCFGATSVMTKVSTVDDHTFAVTITGHDNGGMGCHAWYERRFTGKVVVDDRGAIVHARFEGTETVTADDTPDCREMRGTRPLGIDVRRSCTP